MASSHTTPTSENGLTSRAETPISPRRTPAARLLWPSGTSGSERVEPGTAGAVAPGAASGAGPSGGVVVATAAPEGVARKGRVSTAAQAVTVEETRFPRFPRMTEILDISSHICPFFSG
ncbi:hypothetical protein GCM10020000_49310 [Streptomyces olivoverticillatus]